MIKISVVIPIYNASKTITSVLDSVLNQTNDVFEIILINDNSTDDTIVILKEYISKHVIQKIYLINLDTNRGVSFCRNLGWNNSKGNYVAFLDSDDFWNCNKTEIMIKALIKLNFPSFLGHLYSETYVDSKRKITYDSKLLKSINFIQMLTFNRFQTSCVLIRRDISERFNELIGYSEDYELFLRLSALGHKIYLYKEVLTYLGRPQLTKGGLSGKKMKMRIGEIMAYKSGLSIKKLIILFPILFIYSILKSFLKIHR